MRPQQLLFHWQRSIIGAGLDTITATENLISGNFNDKLTGDT